MITRESTSFDCVGGPLCGATRSLPAGVTTHRHFEPAGCGVLIEHVYVVRADCSGRVLVYRGSTRKRAGAGVGLYARAVR